MASSSRARMAGAPSEKMTATVIAASPARPYSALIASTMFSLDTTAAAPAGEYRREKKEREVKN